MLARCGDQAILAHSAVCVHTALDLYEHHIDHVLVTTHLVEQLTSLCMLHVFTQHPHFDEGLY